MNVTTKTEMVKVAIDKSLLKEYSTPKSPRTVYLNDGEEFQLQLFNPYDYTVAAKIFINGEDLNNLLVLRPGQRIWLERYLDQARKFKFTTYEVDDSPVVGYATRNNGAIRVEFYKEKTQNPSITYISGFTSSPYNWENNILYANDLVKDYSTCYNYSAATSDSNEIKCGASISSIATADSLNFCDCNMTTYNGDAIPTASSAGVKIRKSASRSMSKRFEPQADRFEAQPKSIETGRVEKGSNSNQQFDSVNLDFYTYSFQTENILLLPSSRKAVTEEDLQKVYCTGCGRKLKSKYKFCPYCGSKVE